MKEMKLYGADSLCRDRNKNIFPGNRRLIKWLYDVDGRCAIIDGRTEYVATGGQDQIESE